MTLLLRRTTSTDTSTDIEDHLDKIEESFQNVSIEMALNKLRNEGIRYGKA